MSSFRMRALASLILAMTVVLMMSEPVGAVSQPSAGRAAGHVSIRQDATSSCADPVTSAPTGPQTVSAASTPYGRVLVVGAGAYAGCSPVRADVRPAPCALWRTVRMQRQRERHRLGVRYGPLAGAPHQRCADRRAGGKSHAARDGDPHGPARACRRSASGACAGLPLYRFFLDEVPGETEGVNLFDPVTSPGGTWLLVHPSRGRAAVGRARLQLETAPLGGTGPDRTVLAATMNDDFSLFPNASFPVYTLSTASKPRGHASACVGQCAVFWTPVLTDKRPEARPRASTGMLSGSLSGPTAATR